MAVPIQVTFDAADPDALAAFWAEALGYRLQEPPQGYTSWEDFLRDAGVPEERWGSAAAIVDPDGRGPRIFFQKVPEAKTAKNRVHLDVNVGGGQDVPEAEQRRRIHEAIDRLVGIGGTHIRTVDEPVGYWAVMQDPEGNEFCLQ